MSLQTKLSPADDALVLRILALAHKIQTTTPLCVFVYYSGHVSDLRVCLTRTKRDWLDHIYEVECPTEYRVYKAKADESAALSRACRELELILRTRGECLRPAPPEPAPASAPRPAPKPSPAPPAAAEKERPDSNDPARAARIDADIALANRTGVPLGDRRYQPFRDRGGRKDPPPRKRANARCAEPGCDRKARAKRLCSKHYCRLWRKQKAHAPAG